MIKMYNRDLIGSWLILVMFYIIVTSENSSPIRISTVVYTYQ